MTLTGLNAAALQSRHGRLAELPDVKLTSAQSAHTGVRYTCANTNARTYTINYNHIELIEATLLYLIVPL